MDLLKLLLSLLFMIIVTRIFSLIMAYIGGLLHISDIVIIISNWLKNIYIKSIITTASIIVIVLIGRGSLDKIYAVVCFLILLLTYIDFSQIKRNGENDVV